MRSRLLRSLSRRLAAVGFTSILLLLWGCGAPLPGSLDPGAYLGDRSGGASGADGRIPLVDLERLKTALPIAQPDYQTVLPASVESEMLAAVAQAQSLPLGQLSVTASRARQWRNSCLGIVSVDQLCAQVITPGWQGIISDGSQDWVYHSDEQGEVVQLNASASQTGTRVQFGPLAQVSQLDGTLLSLRLSGLTELEKAPMIDAQAVLIDGRLVNLEDGGAIAEGSKRELSVGQIQAFDQQRNQAQLAQFDGLRYGDLPSTAKQQFWVSLMDSQGLVQYDPAIQAQLPPELQAFVLAWEAIACSGPLEDCVASPVSTTGEIAE